MLDVSNTEWSDFYYEAGGMKINPLDGTRHGENDIDDCWSVRLGTEYLIVLRRTEIPVRAGIAWEQLPALETPDEYWTYTLGTGISLGRDPGRIIFDIAYAYTTGTDVLGGLVSEQEGLSTDVEKHQVFISSIVHF